MESIYLFGAESIKEIPLQVAQRLKKAVLSKKFSFDNKKQAFLHNNFSLKKVEQDEEEMMPS